MFDCVDLRPHLQHFFDERKRLPLTFTSDELDANHASTHIRYRDLGYLSQLHHFSQVKLKDKNLTHRWRYDPYIQVTFGLAAPIVVASTATITLGRLHTDPFNLNDHIDIEWEEALADFAIILGCLMALTTLPWFLSIAWESHEVIHHLRNLETRPYRNDSILLDMASLVGHPHPRHEGIWYYIIRALRHTADGFAELPMCSHVTIEGIFIKQMKFARTEELDFFYEHVNGQLITAHPNYQAPVYAVTSTQALRSDGLIPEGSTPREIADGTVAIRFTENRRGDLADFVGRGKRPLSITQFISVFDQAEAAVYAFHASTGHGVMDLKPPNFLYDQNEDGDITVYLHDAINCIEWEQQDTDEQDGDAPDEKKDTDAPNKAPTTPPAVTLAPITPPMMAPHSLHCKEGSDEGLDQVHERYQKLLQALTPPHESNPSQAFTDFWHTSQTVTLAWYKCRLLGTDTNLAMRLDHDQQVAQDKFALGMSMLHLMIEIGDYWVDDGREQRTEMLARIAELIRAPEELKAEPAPGVQQP